MPLNTKRPRGWLLDAIGAYCGGSSWRPINRYALSAGQLGRWIVSAFASFRSFEPDFASCDVLARCGNPIGGSPWDCQQAVARSGSNTRVRHPRRSGRGVRVGRCLIRRTTAGGTKRSLTARDIRSLSNTVAATVKVAGDGFIKSVDFVFQLAEQALILRIKWMGSTLHWTGIYACTCRSRSTGPSPRWQRARRARGRCRAGAGCASPRSTSRRSAGAQSSRARTCQKAAVRTDIPSLRYISFSVTIAKIQIMRDKVSSSSGNNRTSQRRQAPSTSPSVIPCQRSLAPPAGPTIKVFLGPVRAFKLVLAGIAPERILLKGLARPPKPFAERRSKIIRLRYFWAVPGPAIFACCLAMISAGIT